MQGSTVGTYHWAPDPTNPTNYVLVVSIDATTGLLQGPAASDDTTTVFHPVGGGIEGSGHDGVSLSSMSITGSPAASGPYSISTTSTASYSAGTVTSNSLVQVLDGTVGLPPHASTYNGFSRGYSFTAATGFIIAQLELPPDARQVGDTASFLVRRNGNTVLHDIGNAGALITANITVNTGDVIDVIGNWSSAMPGSNTARNSYGLSAPHATMIQGVPHSLSRSGWQWDIGDPAFGGSYVTPTTGPIGRVQLWTVPQTELLAHYTYFGAGCPGSMGVSNLTASARPALGATMTVTVDKLPASAAIMLTGFSNTTSAFGPLPVDFGVFGAPGCFLRVRPDASSLILGAANTANWSLGVPAAAALNGLPLFSQAIALDPGFNPAGAVSSDAHGGVIGL